MGSDLLIIFRKEIIIMSIAEYCFISSILTILGLLVIFGGILAIGDIISNYKFKKQDKKNREEFVDWLMEQYLEKDEVSIADFLAIMISLNLLVMI